MVQDDERNLEVSAVPPNDNLEELGRFRQALISFSAPDDSAIKRSESFSKCPNRDVENYFEFVAKVGKPYFKWEIIRPAFLWKLNQVMSDMEKDEYEETMDNQISMSSKEELCCQREFIMKKASEFNGTPFTFQRLCELLITPSRHYKRFDKYLRAVEKNINVVTTVTEYGERVTGVDEYLEGDEERPHGIEQSFFVKENGSPMDVKSADTVPDNFGKFMESCNSDDIVAKDSASESKDNSDYGEPMEIEGAENDSSRGNDSKTGCINQERKVASMEERNNEYHQESSDYNMGDNKK